MISKCDELTQQPSSVLVGALPERNAVITRAGWIPHLLPALARIRPEATLNDWLCESAA